MDTTRSLFAVSWNQFRAGHTALTSTSRCLTDGSADRFPEKCIFMPLLRSWCVARIYKRDGPLRLNYSGGASIAVGVGEGVSWSRAHFMVLRLRIVLVFAKTSRPDPVSSRGRRAPAIDLDGHVMYLSTSSC